MFCSRRALTGSISSSFFLVNSLLPRSSNVRLFQVINVTVASPRQRNGSSSESVHSKPLASGRSLGSLIELTAIQHLQHWHNDQILPFNSTSGPSYSSISFTYMQQYCFRYRTVPKSDLQTRNLHRDHSIVSNSKKKLIMKLTQTVSV